MVRETGNAIRVLLADDHTLVREGVNLLLDSVPDIDVVAEASDGEAALRAIEAHTPDVVLMDICMPGRNGIDTVRELTHLPLDTRVLALSMHPDSRMVMEMLRAGARGYVVKDTQGRILIEAIRTVAAGDVYLCPQVTSDMVGRFLSGGGEPAPESTSPWGSLSYRERQVLQLVSDGLTTKQIGQRLHISPKTVETHRRQLMDKLDLYSVAELTKYAIREGLTNV